MEDNSYTSVHSEEETLKIENSGKKIVKETKYRLLEMVIFVYKRFLWMII